MVGEAGKLLISFKNTLPVEMKDVTLNIDIDNLEAGETLRSLSFGPLHIGNSI